MEKFDSPEKQKGNTREKKRGDREQESRRSSREAIDAYNRRIDECGPLLTPHWQRDR
jgi:hypothetical protein